MRTRSPLLPFLPLRPLLPLLALLLAAVAAAADSPPAGPAAVQGPHALTLAPEVAPGVGPWAILDTASQRVSIRASGFAPGRKVGIGVGPVDSEYRIVAWARSDAGGRLEAELPVATAELAGTAWVVVLEDARGRVLRVSPPLLGGESGPLAEARLPRTPEAGGKGDPGVRP